jgi:hypothetical protein
MVSRSEIATMRREAQALVQPEPVVLEMPAHILEFATSRSFANRQLYPAQGTLLKAWNLLDELFTDFDNETLERWGHGFELAGDEIGLVYRGSYGMSPDLPERTQACRQIGRLWFAEMVTVIGRRGSKNYLTAIQVAWAVWRMLAGPDPHLTYELPQDKVIAFYILGANFDQVLRNAFRDIADLINNAPCFQAVLGKPSGKAITLLTPAQIEAGAVPGHDVGLIQIVPAATTPNAVRGPAVAGLVLDEVGHLERGTSAANSVDIYRGARAALAQFDQDSLIIQISSPWMRSGQLYKSHQAALRVDPDTTTPVNPDIFAVQLPSPELYTAAERSNEIEMWPGGPSYGPAMAPKITWALVEKELAVDRWSATVEFLAKYATVGDAYFTTPEVDSIFAPFNGAYLEQKSQGVLAHYYVAHGDPARVNCNFGFSIAHVEVDEDGVPHVVFDRIEAWRPQDFDGTINYNVIRRRIFDFIKAFGLAEVSFDPWNSAGEIDWLIEQSQLAGLPRRPNIHVINSTRAENWKMAEIFKSAVQKGIVHAPHHDLARAELDFLVRNGDRIDHPTSGPVQTKDTVDTMIAATYALLQGRYKDLFDRLGNLPISGSHQATGMPRSSRPATVQELLSASTASFNRRRRDWKRGG